jgi:hypothetical protein
MDKVYKLTIVDNTIGNYYDYTVYELKRKHWWSINKTWIFVEGHTLGKNYMCPEIHRKLKTIEDLFNESLESVERRYTFNEIHNTIIT